jgi:hypothetical protein
MIPVVLLAFAAILAVASVGVSLFAVWRSRVLVLAADERARAGMEECTAATEALRTVVEGLAARMREVEHQAPAASPSGPPPKSGLNLSKRSQVLRMHRNGNPQDQIAAALGVPLQEVGLLIKVHRIVVSNL